MRDGAARVAPPRAFARFRTVLGIAAAVFGIDQLTKHVIRTELALHESIPVVDGFLNIVHVHNPGAAFSLLAGAPAGFRGPFFVGMTIVAVGVLFYVTAKLPEYDVWLHVALGGVLGGALGNLLDRLLYGEVVDFIDVYWGEYHWPAFNVADSCITLAVLMVLGQSFITRRGEGASP